MESTLQIMPVQRTSRNFGEYAEEAVIIEEPIIKQKRPLFILSLIHISKRSHPNYEWLLKIVSQEKQKYLNLIFELRALGKSFTPQKMCIRDRC